VEEVAADVVETGELKQSLKMGLDFCNVVIKLEWVSSCF